MRIVRAGQADHDDAFAIFEEYYDAIAVLVRDDYDALREYLSDPAGLWLALMRAQAMQWRCQPIWATTANSIKRLQNLPWLTPTRRSATGALL